jgi:DNA-binding NtrC family response regulator
MSEQTDVIPQAQRLTLRRVRLRIDSGPSVGTEFIFDLDLVRIGSHESNDIVLPDDTVSRTHAEVVRTPNGVLLRDLDSTNGTYADQWRIREIYLPSGASFRIGRTDLTFESADEVVHVLPSESERLVDLVGSSMPMRAMYGVIERVAPTDLTVLITGETGTGKELVSRAIHTLSPRRNGRFEVFDCGAVARNLVEAELFGHTRGAYTGAVGSRPGVFERAHGGTLFLDELGELPMTVQSSLLRVLEQREVRRLGSREVRQVDVRVVAATNRDLAAEVAAGRFRQDLYYRLAVVELNVPALRQRRQDLPVLVNHLLQTTGFQHNVREISPDVYAAFMAWHWPGNVRELRNVLHRALPFVLGTELRLDALPEALRTPGADHTPGPRVALPNQDMSFHEAKDHILTAFERHYLESLMRRAEGNLSRAARMAGVDRKTVSRMLMRHGLR